MFLPQVLVAAASLIASVSAHATFQEMWINGMDVGNACARLPASNSPGMSNVILVTSVASNDLACNIIGSQAANKCPLMPGDSVTVEMHQQPNDRTCANEAIGGDHFGPVTIYMAKVDNSLTAVGSDASWFKVSELGLVSSAPDYWGSEVLNDNCGHYTFTIPKDIAPGDYLIRAEVIALHVASSPGGAQFYPACFQATVGGSGTAKPSGVKIPGAYSSNDPGILINIYTQLNSYVIPGPTPYNSASPAVAATPYPTAATWNTASQPKTVPTALPSNLPGAGNSGSSGSASTSVAITTAPGSTAPTTVASSTVAPTAAPTSGSSGAAAAQWAQCGGIGWTGATQCVSPFKCSVINPYYSQCI
ncbi:hypothetical protein K435DRAFT_835269 [Dendrothele bispora CBS 962.96]|uniref:AA9 family lytic polysaccharide monooxygenase n=1 Tax=Dendrothele bispora (strain CBS 962.96) TaxID=1314807 RepID=A0A4S8MPA9_DENBC|nr:hypothetical protein K435DRAFT_835269 [Dendrothele bispora CBS 962.96]